MLLQSFVVPAGKLWLMEISLSEVSEEHHTDQTRRCISRTTYFALAGESVNKLSLGVHNTSPKTVFTGVQTSWIVSTLFSKVDKLWSLLSV
ncbi:hypothetical protein FGIG_06889 [Fasciola gigantica]|uniref:Uncharacterized protein n=1 Tax=Fasciola gigantica TaxID=46835 RepID=A0A504YG16_FASGI|nr:hypothetical protein FGIG_06889 [Fasciola gigantica]